MTSGEGHRRSNSNLKAAITAMAPICDGCVVPESEAIERFFENNTAALAFFREHGVLPKSVVCPKCHKECSYRAEKYLWYCNTKITIRKTKRRRACGFSVSDFKGTFLSQCRVSPWKSLLFVNYWLREQFFHEVVLENLKFSRETSVCWRRYCSGVTNHFLENQEPIGGSGVFVEIDESKFGESKYGLGGVWVFGGIERVSKRKFLIPLIENACRNAKTLIPLIQKYIKPDSVIVSDEWPAYRRLASLGYDHRIASDREGDFVDPDTGVHTRTIERLWKDVKSWALRSGIRKEYYMQYFSRYLFVNHFSEAPTRLHHFLRQAAFLYPPRAGLSASPASSDVDDPGS